MAKGHYIPQTFLRNFTDKTFEKELTWQILKNKENEIKSVPIDNICQKSNLYIVNSFDKQEDKEFIEKIIYSKNIESEYNASYKLLINPDKIDVSKDEKELILISILSLYYRHYDNLENKNRIDEKEINYISQYLIERGKETKFANGNLSLDFKNKDEIISKIKKINKEDFAISHFAKTLDLIKKRLNDSISVIKLPNNFSLVSSDRPFYFNDYFGFLSFCLPIDNNHLVLISPIELYDTKINRITYESDDLCTVIELINNEIQYRLSRNIIIAENKDILEGILLKRKDYGLDNISNETIDFSSILNQRNEHGY
jgi:hypothetical protein